MVQERFNLMNFYKLCLKLSEGNLMEQRTLRCLIFFNVSALFYLGMSTGQLGE